MANKKQTSKRVATTASKVLRDNRYSPASSAVQVPHYHKLEKGSNFFEIKPNNGVSP